MIKTAKYKKQISKFVSKTKTQIKKQYTNPLGINTYYKTACEKISSKTYTKYHKDFFSDNLNIVEKKYNEWKNNKTYKWGGDSQKRMKVGKAKNYCKH